jgi:hypothetical protein
VDVAHFPAANTLLVANSTSEPVQTIIHSDSPDFPATPVTLEPGAMLTLS